MSQSTLEDRPFRQVCISTFAPWFTSTVALTMFFFLRSLHEKGISEVIGHTHLNNVLLFVLFSPLVVGSLHVLIPGLFWGVPITWVLKWRGLTSLPYCVAGGLLAGMAGHYLDLILLLAVQEIQQDTCSYTFWTCLADYLRNPWQSGTGLVPGIVAGFTYWFVAQRHKAQKPR